MEFKRNYLRFYLAKLERKMDILMLAQHYGLPTRFLDWTTNPLISLYFACEKVNDKDGKVYIKRLPQPQCLYCEKCYDQIGFGSIIIEEEKDIDPFTITNNEIIFPDNFDSRFINQSGAFEIFDNPQVESNVKPIGSFIVKHNNKGKLLNQLSQIGFRMDFIYPNLDYLCKRIETEHKNQIVKYNDYEKVAKKFS